METQLTIGEILDRARTFDGDTYEPALDEARLTTQYGRVLKLMSDGRWRTLREIADAIGGGSEAGISARLRDMRKPAFGKHWVERRRRGEPKRGLFEYRVSR